jgi:hypothetical protein
LRRWRSRLEVGPWTNYRLRTRLRDFVDAYNFARRLKTQIGLTPGEFICRPWSYHKQRFKISPRQILPGLSNQTASAVERVKAFL